MFDNDELLELTEVAKLLGLGKPATHRRATLPDFPAPATVTAGGRKLWTRAQIAEYARERSAAFVERPKIEKLAKSSDTCYSSVVLSLEVAAGRIGVHVSDLQALGADYRMPGIRVRGELVEIEEKDLGLYARAASARFDREFA